MLTTQDRNNFVLVCQLWREVGEEPRFCYMGILSLTRENLNTIPERLDCRRMRFVRELRVEVGVKVSEEVLQAVARHQGLNKLVMNKIDLSTVEKGLTATVVGNLEARGNIPNTVDSAAVGGNHNCHRCWRLFSEKAGHIKEQSVHCVSQPASQCCEHD
jgi:hypothetical protein